jgi:hypothetical protein
LEKRLKRFALFLLMILVGAALGLLIGWQIAPVRGGGARLNTLRRDYKTDAVMMVAEIYHHEGDLPMAMTRLATLGEGSPAKTTQVAIAYAQEAGYDPEDLALMMALAQDIDQGQSEAR